MQRISLALVVAALIGCSASVKGPKLGELYNRAAQHHDELRHPVIVIPGILGSRLIDERTDRVVWGAFGGDAVNPNTPEGARLVAVPMRRGVPLRALHDGVVPDGALDRVRVTLLGLPVELNAYINILSTLGVGGYRDFMLGESDAVDYGEGHYTCFQFDYDWRRDNVENAKRLHEFIEQTRVYVQGEIERRFGVRDADVRFDIVAHSMGGLVTRYYLRYGDADLSAEGGAPEITWAGAKRVRKAILVGTPNLGSVNALREMVNGVKFAPFLPTYEPAVLGTMPAIYQLLPRTFEHRDLYDMELWVTMGWGLASPERDKALTELLPEVSDQAQRRAIALDHLRKCLDRARGFAAALDEPASPPSGTTLHLFAGDAEDTPAQAAVNPKNHRVRFTRTAPGDGTVLRSSALGDLRTDDDWQPTLRSPVDWTTVHFLFDDHLGMTRSAAFTDNVLYLLLESPK